VSETGEAVAIATGTFTCASCGGTFEKGCTDEEAKAEQRALLIPDGSDDAVTCDDCFRGIMGRVQVEAPELLVPGAPLVEGACYRTEGGLPVHYSGCWCPR